MTDAVLRTPDARFAALPDFPWSPKYLDVKGIRVARVDEGPADAPAGAPLDPALAGLDAPPGPASAACEKASGDARRPDATHAASAPTEPTQRRADRAGRLPPAAWRATRGACPLARGAGESVGSDDIGMNSV